MPYIIERIHDLDGADAAAFPLMAPKCPDCEQPMVFDVGPVLGKQPMPHVGVVYYLTVKCPTCGFNPSASTPSPWMTERERRDSASFQPFQNNWTRRTPETD